MNSKEICSEKNNSEPKNSDNAEKEEKFMKIEKTKEVIENRTSTLQKEFNPKVTVYYKTDTV